MKGDCCDKNEGRGGRWAFNSAAILLLLLLGEFVKVSGGGEFCHMGRFHSDWPRWCRHGSGSGEPSRDSGNEVF